MRAELKTTWAAFAVIVGTLVLLSYIGTPSDSPLSPPRLAARIDLKGEPSVARPSTPAAQSKASDRNSAKEAMIAQGLLEKLQSLGQEIESKNMTTLYDAKNAQAHNLILKITPPSDDQLASLYEALGKNLSTLPEGTRFKTKLHEKGLKQINEFAAYPKPTKLLRVCLRHDGAASFLMEYFVNDENLIRPDENGGFQVPLPPLSVMRYDEEFGKGDSWATKRSAHLLLIE